jgi:hypothetical protein
MYRPSHCSRFDYPNNIWRWVHGNGPSSVPNWLRPIFSEVISPSHQAPRHEGVCETAGITPRILHHDTRGGEWSASRPGPPHVRQRAAGAHGVRGWLGPRANVGIWEKKTYLSVPGN